MALEQTKAAAAAMRPFPVSVAGVECTIWQSNRPTRDPLGMLVFPAALRLLEVLAAQRDWRGVHVLEVGAGTGLVSIGLGKMGAIVHATDYDEPSIENLRFNVDQNAVADAVRVLRWDWADDPPDQLRATPFQYCVASEVAYKGNAELLCKALVAIRTMSTVTEFYLMLVERGEQTVRAFVDCCHSAGFQIHLEIVFAHSIDRLIDEDLEDYGGNTAFLLGSMSLLRLCTPTL